MSEAPARTQFAELPTDTRAPFDLRADLSKRVDELGLRANVAQLRDAGFTAVLNVASPEFTARLRETCRRLIRESGSNKAGLLLGRDPIFVDAVANPKVLALVEVMCGRGAILSQLIAGVRPQGAPALALHSDQNWLPAPFPLHNQMFTMCWTMEEFTKENGATRVVPGSHVHRRHPAQNETGDHPDAIPIDCPANSLACWDGSVWHGNYSRQTEGERVVLHITFCRLALRPVESYDHLDETWLAGKPLSVRTMLGRDDFLGKSGFAGWDEARLPITFEWAKN